MTDSTDNRNEPSRDNASVSSLEDDKLVKQAVGGDKRAYGAIVSKYERALYFHILKMVKDDKKVEDLVQETFMKAFDHLNSYSTDYAFSTWLYRIATNHTIDHLRKKRLKALSIDDPITTKDGEVQMQIPDEDASADRDLIRGQRQEMVRRAIEDLPAKYRKVIRMRHMEEKSYQEISEVLDLPLGTVKAHIFRARELLYKAMKDKRDMF